MNENIKNHLKCILKVIYCYILGIILGWAGYPLLVFLVAFVPINTSIAVYSVFVTVICAVVLYISMHELGENDRRPYKWVRYRGKGFVCGGIASVIVTLIGYLLIFVVDKAVYIQHPFLDIENINSYIKMVVYIPFFWFFEIIKSGTRLIPEVNLLSALIVVPFLTIVAGLGYLTGFMNVNIIKKSDGSDFISKILYKKQ